VNTGSLKFRLVAWYAGWLSIVFIVFGIFVYASLGHHLRRSLREALERRPRQIAELMQNPSINRNRLGREIDGRFAPEANNRFTRVTEQGAIVYVSGDPTDQSFNPRTVPPASAMNAPERFDRRRLPDGTVLLIAALRKVIGGKNVVIEEGAPEAPIQATLHAWLAVLVLGLAFLTSGAVAGGFVLVQRALAPVDRIIQSAEHISSRNLSERLPIAETRDEIERLSTALNHMIERLEESFQQTRRFLADASHELRTPLTMLRAELESVLERAEVDEDVRAVAASALDEVERLRKIVEGLFALSRLEAGEALEESMPFDLAELAASTTDQMCLLAEDKNITMKCDSTEKVIIEGDRSRLKQVTVNLLDNAIKFTRPGGSIDVRVLTRDGKAVLEVEDTGPGIPADALPHVFERFFRVDTARAREWGGAGLGLSIVKSICTAHRGQVEVQSKEEQGSRFTVELPLAPRRVSRDGDTHVGCEQYSPRERLRPS